MGATASLLHPAGRRLGSKRSSCWRHCNLIGSSTLCKCISSQSNKMMSRRGVCKGKLFCKYDQLRMWHLLRYLLYHGTEPVCVVTCYPRLVPLKYIEWHVPTTMLFRKYPISRTHQFCMPTAVNTASHSGICGIEVWTRTAIAVIHNDAISQSMPFRFNQCETLYT